MNLSNENSNWFFLCIGMLILSITLLFPVGSDLSIFIQGGMILHNGGDLYVDFFDVKPPLVYYLFETLFGLFDKNIFGYRAFDFIYQTSFLISCIYIFRKLKLNSIAINLFLISAPLLYTTMGYANVLQVESMFFLPFIWYFYFSFKYKQSFKTSLAKGILLAIIFNMKYTLGVILIADLYFTFFNFKLNKKAVSLALLQVLMFIAISFLTFLPILIKGNLDGMLRFMDYMSVYSSYPEWGMSQVLYMLESLTIHFSDNLSLLFIVAFLYTIFNSRKSVHKDLIDHGLLYFVLLVITIVLERKGLSYHYQRLIPIYILLVSIGLQNLTKELKKQKIFFIIIATSFMVIYSPIPRYINLLKVPYNYFKTSDEKYLNTFEDGKYGAMIYKHKKVAEYLNDSNMSNKVLVMSSNGNELITFLDNDYEYSMAMSAFYLNSISPKEIQNIAFEDMVDSEVIVIVKNDYSPITFFKNISSLEALEENSRFRNYLSENFVFDSTIDDTFVIYKRKH
ncbi:MAG: glycosyltransferase family 39 protein [Chlorobiota bacterium]